jgi:hypothetical protein
MTHNFHWNVTGPMFNTLHLMFMGQYTEQWNALDIIAERIRSLVHPAPGSPDGTLVNALLHHCGASLSGLGGVRRPGIAAWTITAMLPGLCWFTHFEWDGKLYLLEELGSREEAAAMLNSCDHESVALLDRAQMRRWTTVLRNYLDLALI